MSETILPAMCVMENGATMTKDRILNAIRHCRDVTMKDPDIKKEFEYFNKTVQLTFPDVDIDAYFQIGNGAVDALGVGIAETEFEVTMDSSVFFGILEKSVDPEEAFASGKISIRGDSSILKHLRILVP